MKKNKVLILDPACHADGGHNVDLIFRYIKKIKKDSNEVIVAASGAFDKLESVGLKVDRIKNVYPSLGLNQIKYTPLARLYFLYLRTIQRLPLIIAYRNFKAKKSLKSVFKNNELNDNDEIFLPSCDYYYAKQLIKMLGKMKRPPSLHLRFIGVLENEHINLKYSGRRRLLYSIRVNKTIRLKITAETERLAKYISNLTNLNAGVEHYPFEESDTYQKDKEDDKALSVSCPGASRRDKGSFDLGHIMKESLYRCGNSVVFSLQKVRKGDVDFNKRAEKLSNIYPNLRLLDARVSRNKFEEYILDADVILLPYDPSIYWNRGSAVFFESIERGKYMIGRGGGSFVDSMSSLGVIDKYYSVEQLVSLIEYLTKKTKADIFNEGLRRRDIYRDLIN
mgnify:CR=1 FL=1